jgi:hypothetical protein
MSVAAELYGKSAFGATGCGAPRYDPVYSPAQAVPPLGRAHGRAHSFAPARAAYLSPRVVLSASSPASVIS